MGGREMTSYRDIGNDPDGFEPLESDDGCFNCGGWGWQVTCIDDMCHGQDECIHGDPPRPCRYCNADGFKAEF
jgi:hypothetical protein